MDVVAPNLILFFVCWIAIGGGVGALIGSSKGRGPLGFVLGLLLGIIGWIIMAVLSPTPEHAAKGAGSRHNDHRRRLRRDVPGMPALQGTDAT
jgi:F0F1-type ATP synthase assembly protein I